MRDIIAVSNKKKRKHSYSQIKRFKHQTFYKP